MTTPKFANYIDRRIYKAIKGHSSDNPQTLVGIIAYIDSQERMVVSHRELSEGLGRLIDEGLVREIKKHRFLESDGTISASPFSGVSEAEHSSACRDYSRLFDEHMEGDDPGSDFTRQKLVVRWKLDDDSYATDADEEAAAAFAAALEPAVDSSGLAEINGFEYGPGSIDILVFGRETDDDVEDVYRLVVDTFKSHGCPTGSCIVKCFGDPKHEREVIVDQIS